MNEEKRPRFLSWAAMFQFITLLVWGLVLAALVATGMWGRFVDPRYMGLALVSVLILAAMLVGKSAHLMELHEHEEDCRRENVPCSYKHRLRSAHFVGVLIFLGPLLLLAGGKASGPNPFLLFYTTGGKPEESLVFLGEKVVPARVMGEVPFAKLAEDSFQGKVISAEGLLFVPAGAAPEAFRFNHCYFVSFVVETIVPTVRAVSVVLEYPAEVEPKSGSWVRVRGEVGSLDWGGGRSAVLLKASLMEEIPTPKHPYVYLRRR